ncbi:MAG: N-acetylneuraminate synthase [Actinobacteria bacterium]|nr:N-acetylneuraminate synthase [Actinomycetota bacterium]
MMSVIVIAEAGVNHNGDIKIAKSLVDVAVDAKADIVKFQTFSAERQVTKNASKAAYQRETTASDETQYSMLKKLELNVEMHVELISYCKSRNIEFLSTGFDIQSVDLLQNLGQRLFKIPSGEITNYSYLKHIGELRKPVILSTGMSDLNEIKSALDIFEKTGLPKNFITILHCTTSYPAPMIDVNLKAMQTIHKEFDVAVGYSDHTLGIEISIAAVALGASIIEKHFTLDRNLYGPDHKSSLEPKELKEMVKAIRNIELALGDGVKQMMPSEKSNRAIVRKSLVAIKEIKSGDVFSLDNVAAKRPGNGISPMNWNKIVGKKSKRNYLVDDLITDES